MLEPLLGRSPFATHGQRVVVGQRLMQAASDIFLGWVHSDEVKVETILPRGLTASATACGWTLARAHARSGDRIAIAAYLGASDRFDRAVAEFAAGYADLNERDHRDLSKAVAEGRVDAAEGV